MKKTTRWSPDTCDCVFEYEWDSSLEENERTHTLKKVVQMCGYHKNLETTKAYEEVVSENTRKNKVFGMVAQIKKDILSDDYSWSFDKDRKLVVNFNNLTSVQKSQITQACDSTFGIGKVEVI